MRVNRQLLWLRLETVREPRGKGKRAVGIRYQRTDEGTANSEDLLLDMVNCRLCRSKN
jgi:hypothetical protein